jgi:hypothetical protein
MADGRSLWLEVLSAHDTELTGGFDRCFAGGAMLLAEWVELARLCDLRFSHEDQRQILRRYTDVPC